MRLGSSGRRAAAHEPSRLVSQEVLQDLEVQRLVGHDALEPSVFILQLLETARLGDIHAAVLRAPAVERVLADAVPAAELARPRAGFRLGQNGNDLLFREPALLHDSSRSKESQ